MSDASALLGTWKMVSWQQDIFATGERVDALGPNPIGYINYCADARMYALVVKNDRPPPAGAVPTNEEKLRLFDSMLAYAGTYTLHGDRVIHHLNASWNQAWAGTDQVRFSNLEDDTLTIHGAPAKDPHTGQEVIDRMAFRKVQREADMLSEEDKLYAELWSKQSDIFLKLVTLIPVAELAITASWYALMGAGHPRTAHWVAVIGVLVMGAAFVFLRSTAEYISHFRSKISRLLPYQTQKSLTGRYVGLFLPALCGLINFILIFVRISPKVSN